MENNNGNKAAFAVAHDRHLQEGLTKREYIATRVLQGMLAGSSRADNITLSAVQLTDLLIEALEE